MEPCTPLDDTKLLSGSDYQTHFDSAAYLKNEFGGNITTRKDPEIDLFLKLHQNLHDTFKDGKRKTYIKL